MRPDLVCLLQLLVSLLGICLLLIHTAHQEVKLPDSVF